MTTNLRNIEGLPRHIEKEQAYCPYCSKLILVTKTGRLWPHGPREARCKGTREFVR